MPKTLPVTHPSAWLAPAMEVDSAWKITLTPPQQSEILVALANVKNSGLGLVDIDVNTFRLPGLKRLLEEVGTELRNGRGFVLLRGFPVDGLSLEDAELAYCGLCVHLGTPVSQNAAREYFAHITDKGTQPNGFARGYATNRDAKFHIDLTDVVGLLCLRQAREGGISRIASSISVLNALITERADLLPVLLEGFPWDRRDENAPEEAPIGPRIPVFSEKDGLWACRYNRNFIESAFRRQNSAIPTIVSEAFDFMDAAAGRPEHMLEMDFQPGDIQFLSNDTVLHARTEFLDHPEPERKRMLLRAWLQMETPRPLADPDILRDAFVRYGYLGRTMKEF